MAEPAGCGRVTGPGGSNLYFKGLLDKLGVTANVYRVGTYKAVVEPFICNDMSPEARKNYLALDNATLETWRQNIRTARPKANVDLFLRDMNGAVRAAGGDMAKAALAAALSTASATVPTSKRGSSSSAAWPQAAWSRIRASGLLLTLRRRSIVGQGPDRRCRWSPA